MPVVLLLTLEADRLVSGLKVFKGLTRILDMHSASCLLYNDQYPALYVPLLFGD